MKGKTVLKPKNKKNPKQDEQIITKENTENKIIKGKTNLTKKSQKKMKEEKSPSELLIEQIILSYCTDKWQKNVIAMKNRITGKSNKQSKDLRHLIYVLKNIFRYHKYLYLMELFLNMKEIPYPEGLEHDSNYGKINIVYDKDKNDNEKDEEEKTYEIREEIVIEDLTTESLRNKEKNIDNNIDENENHKGYDFKEENEELKQYFYRNDGTPLNRIEIEKDINKLIDLNPEKDIDVERILKSKRLQYKLKHPRFSPFTKKENLDSFVRYLYTYKPELDKDKNEKVIFIKNKTYAYY